MNVILQAFVHNPLLRGYFLADRHNRSLCDRSGRWVKAARARTTCICCEVDNLFSEVGSHFLGSRNLLETRAHL